MNSLISTGVLLGQKGLRLPNMKAIATTKLMLEGLARHPNVEVVGHLDLKGRKISCKSEKGILREVVVSFPTHLDWGKGINQSEIDNMDNKPHRLNAVLEHFEFIVKLLEHGIKVVIIKPDEACLEGVYTRDIGIAIGNKFIHGNMVAEPRWPEMLSLKGGLKPPMEVQLEGGNVIVDGNFVFLGIGDRTNFHAAMWLQEVLGTEFHVIPILLRPGILHLDCAFSPIAKPNGKQGGALVHEGAFASPNSLKLLEAIYGRLFKLSPVGSKLLGANILALDPDTRMVTYTCSDVMKLLRKEFGLKVIPVQMDEIVKGEGFARCSTMPLVREG